ncbi:hypothetical protein S40285_10875 [Stachybotrys chlorohalonatus IBT 40285]|uniref:Uncharacterized protein n=1 Tax=Stachybotrys chlorohalonatus (strain IBT 40285) TaxID=1283841 RepID=A0A084QUH6_STAC4|nr:hypothetical protein S40285_10875 [Stachybotrys chlorohalonata IBT 40285]
MGDPLSAFATACNILQIIEVGTKVLTKAAGYHNATDGALEEQRNLYGTAQSLKTLNLELEAKLTKPSEALVSPAAQELIAANDRCRQLSAQSLSACSFFGLHHVAHHMSSLLIRLIIKVRSIMMS